MIKIGEPIDLKLTKRYYEFVRQSAIKDIFDALVELITNSDDSYHRLYKKKLRNIDGGPILIEVKSGYKNNIPFIRVRDRAEGMTLEDMMNKLAKVGERTSEEGDRGFMARGAKDCTELGDVIFESIVEDRYYKAKITMDAQFIPEENGRRYADIEIRKQLHIERGNGTVVTLIHKKNQRFPRVSTIKANLPLHFALRDILSENSPSEILFKDLNDDLKPIRLVYHLPEGDIVCNEEYGVPGYPGASAKLMIYKAYEPLEDVSEKFRRSGLIIKGRRGIYECSLLQPSFEKDMIAKKIFGRIECEYLDYLMDDYDKRREKKQPFDLNNPRLVIDPNRQYGLDRSHPFVMALLEYPTKKIQELIEGERKSQSKSREDFMDENLKKRLDKLAKAASKYLIQQIEELDDVIDDQAIDKEAFIKSGVLIFPTYANVAVGNIRAFTLYVNRKIFNRDEADVLIKCDSDAIELLTPSVRLVPHKKRSDLLYTIFKIKGVNVQQAVYVETCCDNLPKAEALINVIEPGIEEHTFLNPLEFEHKFYRIKNGSKKTIILFAKYPDIVNKETPVKIISDDASSLVIRGSAVLVPVYGSNYAKAEIVVEARKLKAGVTKLSARLEEYIAETSVRIVQKEDVGFNIEIEIKDEDFGNYRAIWGDIFNKPYSILISRRHPSLKRYLGPPPDFEGRDSVHFRAILAEIVAECVCRKALLLETKHHSWLFQWANNKEDYLIAESVLSEIQKRIKEFLPIAHYIMIDDKDIRH